MYITKRMVYLGMLVELLVAITLGCFCYRYGVVTTDAKWVKIAIESKTYFGR